MNFFKINFWEMPVSLGFIMGAILCIINLLHLEALSVRLSKGSLVLIAVCSVRFNCLLYLVVVSIVVISYLESNGP